MRHTASIKIITKVVFCFSNKICSMGHGAKSKEQRAESGEQRAKSEELKKMPKI
jgi:hypothetical protein